MFVWHLPFDPYPLARPFLFQLNPEHAHGMTIAMLKYKFGPTRPPVDDPILQTHLWGQTFPNPIGLAAGLDKDAEAIDGFAALGFGFLELGGVTPLPQPGNPKPRLFRIPKARALINRFGFNSHGMEVVGQRLAAWRAKGASFPRPVGLNLAKNKTSMDDAADYVAVVKRLGGLVDFATVNVSSPNTPGLRDLQAGDRLRALLDRVLEARDSFWPHLPILVKISPDLSDDQIEETVMAALAAGVQGMIVSNTTIERPASVGTRFATEVGGLSGEPLREKALANLRRVYRLTQGRIPLVASGGVATAEDALARIQAGASLVQIYTVLVYEGPKVVERITTRLAHLLRVKGFRSVAQAVGAETH